MSRRCIDEPFAGVLRPSWYGVKPTLVSVCDINYDSVMTVTDIIGPIVPLTGPTSGIGAAMLDRLTAHPSRPRLMQLARDRVALQRAVAYAPERSWRRTVSPSISATFAVSATASTDWRTVKAAGRWRRSTWSS